MVWMPDEKSLFCGDIYYASFPNLSTPMLEARDVRGWYESLELMATFGAEYLIPSHTAAIVGADEVAETLADHASAVRSVYEQTIKLINEGKTVDEAGTCTHFADDDASSIISHGGRLIIIRSSRKRQHCS